MSDRPRNFTGPDAHIWRTLSASEWAIIEGQETENRKHESSVRRKREVRRQMEENAKSTAPHYSKWAKYGAQRARKYRQRKRMKGVA